MQTAPYTSRMAQRDAAGSPRRAEGGPEAVMGLRCEQGAGDTTSLGAASSCGEWK